jgi:diguanylate cyclase
MSFIQRGEKAFINQTSKSAIAMIETSDLSMTPEIYEVWFTYYSRSKPDLIRAVDAILESAKPITDQICDNLYHQFLSDYKNEDRIRQAGEQLQDTLSSVSDSIIAVKNTSFDYSQALEEVKIKFENADPAEVQRLIRETSDKTKIMLDENRKLEEQLKQSTAIMEDLKRDLEFVRREAITDGLTGLSNRKSFDAEIQRFVAEAKAENKIFTLIMVDIDHFKQFNDKFGHQVGDQVLKLVARTLKDGLKGRDFAARYGGEEFAILLPETPKDGGVAVGNSLRKSLASKDVVNRSTGTVLGRITMSMGVAEYAPDIDADDLIEKADKALYTAKNVGRNQVIAAD